MIKIFERFALITAGGLVSSLVAVAILNPPEKATGMPRAELKFTKSPKAVVGVPQAVAGVPQDEAKGPRFLPIKARGSETLLASVNVRTLSDHKAETQNSADVLDKTFKDMGYDLDQVRTGAQQVPRVFLASMPEGIAAMREIPRKKALFFKAVLPLILKVNVEIRDDRQRLWDLKSRLAKSETLPAAERLWLIVMAERYKVKRGNLSELIKRVDIIPVSLALAQAAEESGWGTSRFTREGNAMFGQWTSAEGEGLVPQDRDADKSHKVRAFKSLFHSTRAYARNLNTHRAYRDLRTMRQQLRKKGAPIRGQILAETLGRYSERGEDYVKSLRALITVNKLKYFDEAVLNIDA